MMKKFLGLFYYEYKMSIQRVSLWVVTLLFSGLYILMGIDGAEVMDITGLAASREALFSQAGQITFSFNLFFPVVAGIAAADRAVRDRSLDVRELIRSTGISNPAYVVGKYLGVTLSLLTLGIVSVLVSSLFFVFYYHWPFIYVFYALWAAILIVGPALFFVTAFSLVCPLLMPTRLYQILFTGYWFWGNYLSREVMFTIADTLLNASGRYALVGVFGMKMAGNWSNASVSQVVLNISVLLVCAFLALFGMVWVLRISEKNGGH
jgi:ABC-type Na+ efflux pump permease subunit